MYETNLKISCSITSDLVQNKNILSSFEFSYNKTADFSTVVCNRRGQSSVRHFDGRY